MHCLFFSSHEATFPITMTLPEMIADAQAEGWTPAG